MRLPVITFCIAISGIAACKKSKETSYPVGIYTEVTQAERKTTLNFLPIGLLIKGETGSNSKDTFSISISGNRITMKHTSLDYPAVSFDFKYIDKNSFEIEFLGAKIPEAPKTMSLYKK